MLKILFLIELKKKSLNYL